MPNFNIESFYKQSLKETKIFFKQMDIECQKQGYVDFKHKVNVLEAKRLLLNENTEL